MKNKKVKTVSVELDTAPVDNGLNQFVRGGIRDAVERALSTKPVVIHCGDMVENGFMIDGEVYTKESAIEKILGDYSWYKG
jgi:hypothetical protein